MSDHHGSENGADGNSRWNDYFLVMGDNKIYKFD